MGIVDLLRSSYQDLLDFLGMSNVLFTVLLLATISLMAFLLMLKRMGIILTPLNVRRINWPKSVLLYRQYQGEYHQVGPQFDLVRRDTAATSNSDHISYMEGAEMPPIKLGSNSRVLC